MIRAEASERTRLGQGSRGIGLRVNALFAAAVLLILSIVAASALVEIPFATSARMLAKGILGLEMPSNERTSAAIAYLIRFPRVVVAALAGALLATAGALVQGLFRNPLADAGIIGISSGAALAGVLAIAGGLATTSSLALPWAAFLGALIAGFLVFFVSTRAGRTELTTLLLFGIAANALFFAGVSLVLSLTRDYEIARQMSFWMMGGLDGRAWSHVRMVWPFALAGLPLAMIFHRDLDLLLLGHEGASTLGVDVQRTKSLLLLLAALMAGAAVAVAGTIGFVGLIVPHAMRLVVGPGHRRLLPAAALGGATLLVWCDLLARGTATATEPPLGVITAFLGAPIFLHLLFRERKRWRGES